MFQQKCENCSKKNHILVKCSFCSKNICLKCKDPFQGHSCIDKDQHVKNFREELSKKLPLVKAVKIEKV